MKTFEEWIEEGDNKELFEAYVSKNGFPEGATHICTAFPFEKTAFIKIKEEEEQYLCPHTKCWFKLLNPIAKSSYDKLPQKYFKIPDIDQEALPMSTNEENKTCATPDFDFKIANVKNPSVKKFLAENGFLFEGVGNLNFTCLHFDFLVCNTKTKEAKGVSSSEEFTKVNVPELIPEFIVSSYYLLEVQPYPDSIWKNEEGREFKVEQLTADYENGDMVVSFTDTSTTNFYTLSLDKWHHIMHLVH